MYVPPPRAPKRLRRPFAAESKCTSGWFRLVGDRDSRRVIYVRRRTEEARPRICAPLVF